MGKSIEVDPAALLLRLGITEKALHAYLQRRCNLREEIEQATDECLEILRDQSETGHQGPEGDELQESREILALAAPKRGKRKTTQSYENELAAFLIHELLNEGGFEPTCYHGALLMYHLGQYPMRPLATTRQDPAVNTFCYRVRRFRDRLR